MARNSVFRSVLLAAGALLMGACASQPDSWPGTAAVPGTAAAPAPTPLLEKKFQQAAKQYDKYQHEGQVVYCKRGATRSLPPTECITESALRLQVENMQRSRNPVQRPFIGTVSSIG